MLPSFGVTVHKQKVNRRARKWQAGLAERKGMHTYFLLMDQYSMKKGKAHFLRCYYSTQGTLQLHVSLVLRRFQ